MNVHPNSEPRSAHGKDSNVPDCVRGLAKKTAQSSTQETPKSVFRASDLNLMTERGEEEHDRSPQHETPHSIFLPARLPDRNYRQLDPVLGALAHLQRPVGAQDALTDAQLSDYCASGQHSRQPSGAEVEVIPLRLRSNQKISSKTARKLAGQGPQPQRFVEQTRLKVPEGGPDSAEQRPSTIRNALSLDPLVRTAGPGEQDVAVSSTEINMTNQFGRALGPSASQPPQAGFQPVITSRERLHLVNASAWRSPVRTTAAGNIGLLSSHLKLNRQLLSGTHQRSYRDYHRDLLQERSVRLEDELIQTATTLRQKEGSLKIKIALLEQQAAQMRQEMSDAKKREEAQKSTYDQILQIIHRQLLDANLSEPSYNAILINLNYVQHMLNGANKNFAEGAAVSQSLKAKLDDCQAPPRLEEQAEASEKNQTKQLQEQIANQSALIKKYEEQNKEFMDQISRLQVEVGSQKETITSLEEQRRDLSEKVAKFEGELKEQREREQKLKALHSDEMKFNEEMNTYEQQLFQSKIKELETNLASMHNRMQIWNMTEVNVEGASQGSQIGAADDTRSPRRPMFHHSVRLESLQNCLRKQRRSNSNSNGRRVGMPESCTTPLKAPYAGAGGSVVAAQSAQACDHSCQTEESVFQDSIQKLIKGLRAEYDAGKHQKEEENREIREKMNQMQAERENELQTWQKRTTEQEATISRLRREIEENLARNQETTGGLEQQLQEALEACQQKEEDNQALRSQILLVWKQVEKLEKIQRGEASRSRSRRASGSPRGLATDSKGGRASGPGDRNCQSPASAQRQKAQIGQNDAVYLCSTGQKGAHSTRQQLFGLKQQVQSMISQDQDQKGEAQPYLRDAARSPTHADQGCHRVLHIDLSGDICPLGNSNDKSMGQRSRSSRRLAGQGKIRVRDFEEHAQDPMPSKSRKEQHADSKQSLCADNGKASGAKAAAARGSKENAGRQVPWRPGKRQASPGDPSLKKIHSTKAILKTSNQKSPPARAGLANERGPVVCINLPIRDQSRESDASPPSQQPRVRKHDCLNGVRKNPGQGAGEADAKKRVAKCADSISERQRQLKPSLKSRSSSRVTSVKNELAKQLQALRSSGGQESPASDGKKGLGSRIPRADAIQHQPKQGIAQTETIHDQEVLAGQAEALRQSLASSQSFNLQMINQHMRCKEKEMEAKQGSGTESGRYTASHKGLLKSSAGPGRSGESCDWGPSPGLGSSVIKNRRKMDKYSFQQNHRLQSMNNNNRVRPLGAYGKAKSSRYDTFSDNSRCQMNDAEEQPAYFGDVSQKKLITNLSQKGASQGPGRSTKKTEGRRHPQADQRDLYRCPALVQKVQDDQANEELPQKQYSPAGYGTQPGVGARRTKGLRSALAAPGSTSAGGRPSKRNRDIEELLDTPGAFAADPHKQHESLRPEVQIALSESSQHGDQGEVGQTGYFSSQISPVKQEAPKASIQDLAKGSPALESRRLHDHYQFSNVEAQCRSKSQSSRKLGAESRPLSKLMQPIKTKPCEPEHLPGEHDQPSSQDSDTSIGSELLNEDGEDTTPIENQAQPATTAVQRSSPNRLHQLHTIVQPSATSYNSTHFQQPALNGYASHPSAHQSCIPHPASPLQGGHSPGGQPVYVPPDFLGKLDELFGRIHQRDLKVNKLKARNKGLKQKLDQLEAMYREVCQKFEASVRQKEEAELQLQKFECRLKQAQIVLNDASDRVDLQLNRPSAEKGEYEETEGRKANDRKPAGRDLGPQQPERQELLRVQSSIQDLQRKKSQIRQAEKSRQRSLQQNLVSQPESCSRNSDHPGVILATEMSQLQVPSMPKSPHQSTQQLPGWSRPHGGMSFLSKRANSMSSTPNLYQFKRQFQSMSKPNKQPAVPTKHRAVPLIDLSGLDQSKQSEWVDPGQFPQEDVGHRPQPAGFRSAFKDLNGCMSQRPALKASPLPPQTPLSALLHGRSQSKQKRQHDSSVQVNAANYFSQTSNLRPKMRDFDEQSVEAAGIRSCAALKPESMGSQIIDQSSQENLACSRRPRVGDGKSTGGLGPSRDAAKTGRQFGPGNRLAMHKRNGSRTCNALAAEEWKERNQLMSSAMAQAAAQNLLHGQQGRATETAGVLKHFDLQDNKSVASTQPSKTVVGADSSKRSIGTGDSKSSLPFAYLKKQQRSIYNGGSVAQNLLHKSSESALSVIPHRQRASKKSSQIATVTTPTDEVIRGPYSQHSAAGAPNTSRPHLNSRLAMALSAAEVAGTSAASHTHRRGAQLTKQQRAAFR